MKNKYAHLPDAERNKNIVSSRNEYSGSDCLMLDGDPMSIHTLKLAYRKHTLGDDSIGWEELEASLLNALCMLMGDDEFDAWVRDQESDND